MEQFGQLGDSFGAPNEALAGILMGWRHELALYDANHIYQILLDQINNFGWKSPRLSVMHGWLPAAGLGFCGPAMT